jgi:DNA polymerase-3 subunit epsilon
VDALRKPVDERRWVVLDVETSGLDPRRDQLLAIAAIALQVDWPAQSA